MKSAKKIFCLALLPLLLLSCSKLENKILGKWLDDNSTGFEFYKDGTVIMYSPGELLSTLSGKYSLVDKETLKMEFTVYGTTTTHIYKVGVSGNELRFISDDNESGYVYKKVD